MKAWIGAGLVALSVLLAVPATATAKPGSFEFPGFTQATFSLAGTNGFRISVNSYGRRVYVQASQGKSVVTYWPRGRHADGGDIDVALPGVGRISVEFQPRGQASRIAVFDGCEGRPGYRQRGVFVGTIRFAGERDYTRASSHRANGSLTRTFDETCKEDGVHADRQPNSSTLYSSAHQGRTMVGFSATRFEEESPFGTFFFTAFASTSRPRMSVTRLAFAAPKKPHGFSIADPTKLDSAVLTPPKPFTGSATYGLNPDGSGSWTGTLSVELPGLGTVALAGPRFEAGLCRLRHCTGDDLIGTGSQTSFAVIGGRRR